MPEVADVRNGPVWTPPPPHYAKKKKYTIHILWKDKRYGIPR
jgi:hypothetical protein